MFLKLSFFILVLLLTPEIAPIQSMDENTLERFYGDIQENASTKKPCLASPFTDDFIGISAILPNELMMTIYYFSKGPELHLEEFSDEWWRLRDKVPFWGICETLQEIINAEFTQKNKSLHYLPWQLAEHDNFLLFPRMLYVLNTRFCRMLGLHLIISELESEMTERDAFERVYTQIINAPFFSKTSLVKSYACLLHNHLASTHPTFSQRPLQKVFEKKVRETSEKICTELRHEFSLNSRDLENEKVLFTHCIKYIKKIRNDKSYYIEFQLNFNQFNSSLANVLRDHHGLRWANLEAIGTAANELYKAENYEIAAHYYERYYELLRDMGTQSEMTPQEIKNMVESFDKAGKYEKAIYYGWLLDQERNKEIETSSLNWTIRPLKMLKNTKKLDTHNEWFAPKKDRSIWGNVAIFNLKDAPKIIEETTGW